MKLTDIQIRNAKPKKKVYKLGDGTGLYLQISPSGGKYWRYNYIYLTKNKTLSLGTYPKISLKEARKLFFEAKQMLEDGVDPSFQKKVKKSLKLEQADNTFQSIALEWISKQRHIWAKTHTKNVEQRLNNYVFDFIGNQAIATITVPELLAMLRRIEAMGYHETAHRVRSVCGQVFRYAIATGRAHDDPTINLKGALIPVQPKHFSALTDPNDIAGLLHAIDDYSGDFVTRCALKFAPLVFVRPGELRKAEWSEIDFVKKEWLIPAKKMKMKNDHIVPLSKQAIEILLEIQPVTGKGLGIYVFPSILTRKRPMSENTINTAIRRMGYTSEEMTGHGFRAMASTNLNEQGFHEDWIEAQLAHTQRNKVRAAYNRAKYLPQRKDMMQKWADYLDSLRKGADVISINRNA